MKACLVLVLLAFVGVINAFTGPPTITQARVNEIYKFLRTIVQGRLAAHMIRAVFHDCTGPTDGKGICDGCINRDVPPNQGPRGAENWIATVDALDNLYNFLYSTEFSRADFYVLAAQAGIENAVELANEGGCPPGGCVPKPRFNFRVGRCDCSETGLTEDERGLPSGHLGEEGVFDFFRGQFGMTDPEVVAIMGGHTLGGSTGFSGWRGFWSKDAEASNRFDNGYYRILVDNSLNFEQIRPDLSDLNIIMTSAVRRQWNATRPGNQEDAFMLNADFALWKRFTVNFGSSSSDPNSGLASCTTEASCPASRGAQWVQNMANSNTYFMRCFEAAWEKMVSASPGCPLSAPGANSGGDCPNISPNCPAPGTQSATFCNYSYFQKNCPRTCNTCP